MKFRISWLIVAATILLTATVAWRTGAQQAFIGTVRTDYGAPFSCLITLSTNTTTQCQAAPGAGTRNYVTSVVLYTSVAGSATTVTVDYGTGTNCGTGTTALTPGFGNTATGVNINMILHNSGLVPPQANAICAAQAGTTAGTTAVLMTGFVAP